jgi:tetratricopeptide (TPR) repeat protein
MRAGGSQKSADLAARAEFAGRVDALRRSPAPAAEARDEGSDVVVTGTRASRNLYASRRGDWNACTVNDPARSLEKCRRQIDGAGKAGSFLSEGLSRAWDGDYARAIAAFDAAIAANPRSSFAYLNRGLVLSREGETDRAVADLDKAVRYGSASARAYFNRSLVLRGRGDTKRADQDRARAVNLDPDYSEIVE